MNHYKSIAYNPNLPTWITPTAYGTSNNTTTKKVDQLRESIGYSSTQKAFYGTVPINTQSTPYFPLMGHFDITRLPQTNCLDIIKSPRAEKNHIGVVSISKTIAPICNKIGTMSTTTSGESLGTCALISENLVLVARHAVHGQDVRNIKVNFGYMEDENATYSAGQTLFDYVIEEDVAYDYAIIQLKEQLGKKLGYLTLNTEGSTVSEPDLLHYPLGKTLKVSVHTFVQSNYYSKLLSVFHDSDYLSSGGVYIDPRGEMIALHLGAQRNLTNMNLLRYAMPLREIVKNRPDSILRKFPSGTLLQDQSYASATYTYCLAPTNHNYLIDEEGYQSELILRALLKNELPKDKKIKLTKAGAISFSKANLAYIEKTYPKAFKTMENKCLNQVGLHGHTQQYSIRGVIESDHTIPHNVWNATTNAAMKAIASGGGTRGGENQMPAYTLQYDHHRALATTGSSTLAKNFCQKLVTLCNNNQVDKALIACFKEYKKQGVDLKKNRSAIEASLSEYVKRGIITSSEKQYVINEIKKL